MPSTPAQGGERWTTGWRLAAAALAILVLGLWVRTQGLARRGLLLVDEGDDLCEARYFAGAVRAVPAALELAFRTRLRGEAGTAVVADLRARIAASVAGGAYPCIAKNTHGLLVGLLFVAAGEADWVGNAESACFGALTLLVVLFLARASHGPAGALVAMLALAVCPLHVLLSRGSLAEADAIFFMVVAVALVGRALQGGAAGLRPLFLAGVAAGLSFTCNKRFAVAPVAVVSTFAVALLAADRPLAGRRLSGLTWLAVGMLLPLLAWESVYWLAFWALGVAGPARPGTYFVSLFQSVRVLGVPGLGFGDPASLPFFLSEYVGATVLVLAIAGLLRGVLERRPEGLGVGFALLWTIAFFQLRKSEQCVRYLGPALPFLALAAGGAVASAECRTAVGRAARWLLPWTAGVAILLVAWAEVPQYLDDRSGLPQVFAWLRARRASGDCRGYFTVDKPEAIFYDPPGEGVVEPQPTMERLERMVRGGKRYWVTSHTFFIFAHTSGWGWRFMHDLHERVRPVEFDNPGGRLAYLAHEANLYSWTTFAETERRAERLRQAGGKIRVYDLQAWFDAARRSRPGK